MTELTVLENIRRDSAGRAGIATRERIKSNDDLVRILRSGEYAIISTEA